MDAAALLVDLLPYNNLVYNVIQKSCVCVYPMGAHVEVLRIFFYFARVLFSHVHFLFTVSCTSVLFSSNLSFRTVFFPFSTVYNILVIIAR